MGTSTLLPVLVSQERTFELRLEIAQHISDPLWPVHGHLFNSEFANRMRMHLLLFFDSAGTLITNGDSKPFARFVDTITSVKVFFVEFKRRNETKGLPICPL